MKYTHKFLSVFTLAAMLALAVVTPAFAFDGRGGDKVVVASGDVVNDDLYVGAKEFVLDGTVNGDVIVFAQTITINGTVDGDLMAAGQTIIVNGSVTGAIRMAGSVLLVGEGARIGRDLIGAGYSLEARKGSTIGQDLVYAGSQLVLAGEVDRNVQVAGGSFDLRGNVGGNVTAEVGGSEQGQYGPPPTMFMPQSAVAVPAVKPGLTIDPSARITGNLEYTHNTELTFPAGVVGGKVIYSAPEVTQPAAQQETAGQKVAGWALGFVRSSITLILIGLFLLWRFPAFLNGLSEKLQARPLPSLGSGLVAWAAFVFALLLVTAVMIIGAILFGVLTLGQLTGTVIWLGLLALFGLTVGFVLVTSFVAKVVVGTAFGKWILIRSKSPLAEHRYWPMVIGILITLAVIALLSFPLIPGFLGWLLNLAVVLSGLGALWIWGRERMPAKSA